MMQEFKHLQVSTSFRSNLTKRLKLITEVEKLLAKKYELQSKVTKSSFLGQPTKTIAKIVFNQLHLHSPYESLPLPCNSQYWLLPVGGLPLAFPHLQALL